jgi:ribosome biogenesis GTPase
MAEGIVIKSTGNLYTVMLANRSITNCILKGNFKMKGIKSTNPIAVGDKVDFIDNGADDGLITKIHERKNYIVRKSINLSKQSHILAANIDRAFLVATLIAPRTSNGFIDRFLLTAEAYHIPVTILFNKSDLYDADVYAFAKQLADIYEPLGYQCQSISAFKAEDIEDLKKQMQGNINLFSGHSGVGKSTLINALESSLKIKTAKISIQHLKGTHTTTFAEMHPLSFGGFIIDTPGIRDFSVIDFKKEEISHFFPEMRALIKECKFNNCLHLHEPQCAVKAAVEAGTIHQWRYYSYLSILNNEDNYK